MITEERQAPLPGNVLQTVVDLDAYTGQSGRADTSSLDDAQVITSMIERTDRSHARERRHRPVLDLDLPAQLIPSSTPGHFHLYLDVEVPHDAYMRLLRALGDAGVLQEGYVGASLERGYTAARLPWVRKSETTQDGAPC